jgi:hypothetical protein
LWLCSTLARLHSELLNERTRGDACHRQSEIHRQPCEPLSVRKDVLALDYDGEFDGAYCLGSTFVYMTTYEVDPLWVIEENGRVSLDADRDEYRIFFPDEPKFLIEIAGFETVAVYGDDLSSAFTPASHFATFVARKALQAERAAG